jgi:hypothetical protein
MAPDFARGLLIEQRRRMVGGIMAHAEQSQWWPDLDHDEQRAFRDKVLGSTGAYHDVALDCLKAAADGPFPTDQALTLIQSLHERAERIEALLA